MNIETQIIHILQKHNIQVNGITFYTSGMEADVYKAETASHGKLAVKVPRFYKYQSYNNNWIFSKDLLKQESIMYAHMKAHDLPALEEVLFYMDETIQLLVTEFVETDGSAPDARALGKLVARIHSIPTPDHCPVEHMRSNFYDAITNRILHRAQVYNSHFIPHVHLVPQDVRCTLLERKNKYSETCILHMDIRPENILSMQSSIQVMIDWSNAMIGDPALEFARIKEYAYMYNLFDSHFYQGYAEIKPKSIAPDEVMRLYCLDTALMFAVLFKVDAPNPILADHYRERIMDLL